tara:strand:- start:140 stop:745 length:606 start_codon:yes stop_codon:yes gene_type:complete
MNQIIRIKCVLLGNANAGKSSLVFRYIKKSFTSKCQTTVGCSFNSKEFELDNKIVKLDIWDTAGQEKYRSLLPLYYKKAKLVLLCFDLSVHEPNLKKDVNYWFKQLDNNSEVEDRVIFFVGTKEDIKCDKNDKLIEELQKDYPDIIYIETSSKEDTNISYLFDYSVKEVLSKIKAPVVLDRVMEFPSVEEEEVGCLKCIIN